MSQKQLTGKQSDFLEIVVATAARGDLEATREFVDNKPEWIHTVGSHGRTMLWESAYRGKQRGSSIFGGTGGRCQYLRLSLYTPFS